MINAKTLFSYLQYLIEITLYSEAETVTTAYSKLLSLQL